MPFSILYNVWMDCSMMPVAALETNPTWLSPGLLRQPVRGAALDRHSFKSCDLSTVYRHSQHKAMHHEKTPFMPVSLEALQAQAAAAAFN